MKIQVLQSFMCPIAGFVKNLIGLIKGENFTVQMWEKQNYKSQVEIIIIKEMDKNFSWFYLIR